MKKLGIIGGVGPATTASFYLQVLGPVRKFCRSNPEILIASIPLATSIEEQALLHSRGVEKFLPILVEAARKLERAGADFIVLPCNSLHCFIGKIKIATQLPTLNILQETAHFLQGRAAKKVGVLASGITVSRRLYERELESFGITPCFPDEAQQKEIGKIIFRLVSGDISVKDKETIEQIMSSLANQGADCLVLACTDLQLLHPAAELPIFDTMQILADAAVREVMGAADYSKYLTDIAGCSGGEW